MCVFVLKNNAAKRGRSQLYLLHDLFSSRSLSLSLSFSLFLHSLRLMRIVIIIIIIVISDGCLTLSFFILNLSAGL